MLGEFEAFLVRLTPDEDFLYGIWAGCRYEIMPMNLEPQAPTIYQQGGVEAVQYGYARITANATTLKFEVSAIVSLPCPMPFLFEITSGISQT